MKALLFALILLVGGVCGAEEKNNTTRIQPKKFEDDFTHSNFYRGGYEQEPVKRDKQINLDEMMQNYTSSVPDYSSQQRR